MQDSLGRMNHMIPRDLVYKCAMKTTDRRYVLYQLPTYLLPSDIPVDRRTQYIRTLIHVLSLVICDQSSYSNIGYISSLTYVHLTNNSAYKQS